MGTALQTSQPNCFWQCGLVPHRLTHNLGNEDLDLHVEGVFDQPWHFDNLPRMHFGGDASGGPHSKKPRKRKVAFSVTAVQFDEARQAWNVVGKLTANLTGKCQTVPRGEATALLYCLKATRNSVKFVTDAQCMWHRCVSIFASL